MKKSALTRKQFYAEKFKNFLANEKPNIILIGEVSGRDTKTQFKCLKCGETFETTPHVIFRSPGQFCKKCNKKLIAESQTKTNQQFLDELKLVNADIIILDSYTKDHNKVTCKCLKCGNIFKMSPNHLLRGHGCNVCCGSIGEKLVNSLLKQYNISYFTQVSLPREEFVDIVPRLDFWTGNYVIEYNGEQHYKPIDRFGGEEKFIKQQYRDNLVREYCKDAGYDLIEIPYTAKSRNNIQEYLIPILKEGMIKNTLISRDSKNKIRVVQLLGYWEESDECYIIDRRTSQLNGKETQQPLIYIRKANQKRTLIQQFELEYNSKLKEYKDKGYKTLEELSISDLNEKEINKKLPAFNTSQNGVIKPMLCKKETDITDRSIFNQQWLASRKINGVRCLMYWNGSEVLTSTRGGSSYDISTTHLRTHPILIEIFQNNPTLILDMELYAFGKSLQQCSGAARLETSSEENTWLEMYVYDCYFTDNQNMLANERIEFLVKLAKRYKFTFCPEKIWNKGELQIQIVPHEQISGWNNMIELHDKFVSEGWEGLVIRKLDSIYKPGSRGQNWIKIKKYIDDTYKIIGYSLGMRGSEDMTFTCEMPDGKTFKASPLGNRAIKQEYVDNFETKYKNHLGDCKYFELSDEGIPCQPKFICWRFDLE